MKDWQCLESPAPGEHLVQFYPDTRTLAMSLTYYAANGLRQGESMVVIARPENVAAFRGFLGEEFDVPSLCGRGRLRILDAAATLAKLCEDGRPDRKRFHSVVPAALEEARAASPARRVRAYGEMVDILRHAGDLDAAIQLEGLWNELLSRSKFSLFCAYEEGLSKDEIKRVCLTHSYRLELSSPKHDERAAFHGHHRTRLQGPRQTA